MHILRAISSFFVSIFAYINIAVFIAFIIGFTTGWAFSDAFPQFSLEEVSGVFRLALPILICLVLLKSMLSKKSATFPIETEFPVYGSQPTTGFGNEIKDVLLFRS